MRYRHIAHESIDVELLLLLLDNRHRLQIKKAFLHNTLFFKCWVLGYPPLLNLFTYSTLWREN